MGDIEVTTLFSMGTFEVICFPRGGIEVISHARYRPIL